MVLTISKSFLCLALLVTSAAAQKYVPPPPPLTPGPCVPTKKDPCDPPPSTKPPSAADSNPFPGETTPAAPDAATQNPFPGESPATKPAPPNASPDNPFPGEPAAAKPSSAASQNPFPGEPESSSSSSNASGITTNADSVPDPDATASNKPLTRTQRRHLAKVEDLDHRELEDLDIARYYMSTGDFKAAYLRAKDATVAIPDDPDAYFAMAEAAARLKNTAEAVTTYKKYLEMDPEGIHAKAAHKALATLAAK